jgi:putative flippase GtrA
MNRAVLARLTRCFAVSVGTTLLSAGVLVVLAVGLAVPAGTANVVAVACGIGPSYVANRRWVWRRTGRGSMAREVAPFWMMSFIGLVLSTVAVAQTAALTASWPASVRAIALPAANLAVFGVLWCAQFVVLDRIVFSPNRAPMAA